MKHFINYIVYFLSFLSFSEVSGQSTTDNNVPGAGKYLGYNGQGPDLDLHTNNINRMRLIETGNTTRSGYNVSTGGHLGLSLTPDFFGTGPKGKTLFSLLQLNGFQNSPITGAQKT